MKKEYIMYCITGLLMLTILIYFFVNSFIWAFDINFKFTFINAALLLIAFITGVAIYAIGMKYADSAYDAMSYEKEEDYGMNKILIAAILSNEGKLTVSHPILEKVKSSESNHIDVTAEHFVGYTVLSVKEEDLK